MDSAVNNRIIDVAFSGGFILSDRKINLKSISDLSEEIIFDTVDALNLLIEKFSSNQSLYKTIKNEWNKSITSLFTYQVQTSKILSNL